MAIELTINGKAVALDVPGDTPLLWAVRDELDLKGTKFGCGIGCVALVRSISTALRNARA